MMTIDEHLSKVTQAESILEQLINAGAPGSVIQAQIDKRRAAINYAEFCLSPTHPEQYQEFKHRLGIQ